MKNEEPKFWREQTHSCSKFTNGNDALTRSGIFRFDGDSPNGKPRSVLEFCGECEDKDGRLVKRRKRYDITTEIATDIVKAMEAFAPDRTHIFEPLSELV
jgi:hypothetical protein